MKKATAIFLLFLFCLNQTGHFISFYIQKWHIQCLVREEILAGIPDRYLKIIEENSAIEWEEKGKEFKFKDEFYDVARTKIIDGKKLLFCLNDKNEERLIKNFANTVKSSTDNERGKNNKHAFKFHLMDQNIDYASDTAPFERLALHNYCNYVPELLLNCKEIIIPPPRTILS